MSVPADRGGMRFEAKFYPIYKLNTFESPVNPLS
jgi:hypothetical protein